MRNYIILLLLLATALGCTDNQDSIVQENAMQPPVNEENQPDELEGNPPVSIGPITYLALGDSYTIGQGVEESMRWPNQLKDMLKLNNVDVSKVDIIASTGWTTSNLLRAVENQNLSNYDLVSILIGVNNQFRGKPFSQFENEFDELLAICQGLAGESKNVFVVSIPDYGVTPYGAAVGSAAEIAMEIDQYNNYIQVKCNENEITYIDVTDISRLLADSESALVSDLLHPSAYQYLKWTEIINSAVLDLLRSNND